MVRALAIALVLFFAASALECRVILDQRARLRAWERDAPKIAAAELAGRQDELVRAGRWLHEDYSSESGLRRSGGLVQDGEPDFVGISVWLVDTYLRHRLQGSSEPAARVAVVEAIERTPEWQDAHRAKRP